MVNCFNVGLLVRTWWRQSLRLPITDQLADEVLYYDAEFRTTMSVVRKGLEGSVRVRVHPRVLRRHSDVTEPEVVAAFESTLRSRARDTDPIQWVGVGVDGRGRLLEYVAVEDEPDGWLVFYAMQATAKVLTEVGLRR
ncbi:hypothetical protein JOD52_003118 [Brachybacterium muris]|uniref:hypothetical protein n=1 Tax=Brachybacterium muris TaxID=219301 RepID=UPI001EF839C9|nr:hypothetical protein [Brachybacterium muris]MBM7502278.1 hypothetical protein [Brachybacterium muris]MCT1429728.1 hypothetical protein [Brachybacterium muris]